VRAIVLLPLIGLLVAAPPAVAADPNPEDLIGKWVLTEAAAGMPAGTEFDFQKGGKLQVIVELKGEKKAIDFNYELKGKVLRFDSPDTKADTTEVVTLSKTELVCKDANGTVAKFRRVQPK
jgi:uncharacterized protein (TIGR03066 family)